MDILGCHELIFHVLDDIVKLLVAGNVEANVYRYGLWCGLLFNAY